MSGMQFGIFTIGDVTTDPTTGRTISEHDRIKDTVTIAKKIEEVGLDVTPYTDRVANGETGLYPLVENSASIAQIMQTAFDQAWMRQIDGADFVSFNNRVNALFD